MIDLKERLTQIRNILNNQENWNTLNKDEIVRTVLDIIDDALLPYQTVDPNLVKLSEEATPGDWFWDSGIKTSNNPELHPWGPTYQYVLWPQNIPTGDDLTVVEEMGACGVDTEAQAEANQKLLVASVNYIRFLIENSKPKESK